jgi:hypothetical protein
MAKFCQKVIFLPLAYFWRNLDPNYFYCHQKFIHLNPFSSTFRAFIQHPDELASGYVLVVPPGRKIKNHRKNIAPEGAIFLDF